MRGMIEELETPHPLGRAVPGLYQEDLFTQRWLRALDAVWAPIICTLDNLDAYFDPDLAPADFAEWLAGWVGVVLDETCPANQQRALLARAHDLHRWRGTIRGLSAQIALYAGVEPEVSESGGASWSPTPGGPLPGKAKPQITVTVRVADPAEVDAGRLDAIVAAAKPAHVEHRVKVVAA